MACFSKESVENEDLDWWILMMGGICLYRKPSILAADLDWLQARGYETKLFKCSGWNSESEMHAELALRLGFPSYYGNNLNALNDCLIEDVLISDVGGLVLVLEQYDRFTRGRELEEPRDIEGSAHALLDICARASRNHMLQGRRFIVLVQSDDPLICFEELDRVGATWNPREWMNRDRGL